MSYDLAKNMNRDARVGHPCQSRVPKIVTAKLLVT